MEDVRPDVAVENYELVFQLKAFSLPIEENKQARVDAAHSRACNYGDELDELRHVRSDDGNRRRLMLLFGRVQSSEGNKISFRPLMDGLVSRSVVQ